MHSLLQKHPGVSPKRHGKLLAHNGDREVNVLDATQDSGDEIAVLEAC
jgi:hypothetical protein